MYLVVVGARLEFHFSMSQSRPQNDFEHNGITFLAFIKVFFVILYLRLQILDLGFSLLQSAPPK